MAKRLTMTVSMPAPMKVWVDTAVAAAGYGTASEYIRELVRLDHQRRIRDAVNAELIASVESGPPRRIGAEEWRSLRERIRSSRTRARARRAG